MQDEADLKHIWKAPYQVQPESRCNRANSPQESLDIDRTSRSNRPVLFAKKTPAALPQFSPKSLPPTPASWMPTGGCGRGGAGPAREGGRGAGRRQRARGRSEAAGRRKRRLRLRIVRQGGCQLGVKQGGSRCFLRGKGRREHSPSKRARGLPEEDGAGTLRPARRVLRPTRGRRIGSCVRRIGCCGRCVLSGMSTIGEEEEGLRRKLEMRCGCLFAKAAGGMDCTVGCRSTGPGRKFARLHRDSGCT
jgi:hypothetical protein